MTTKKILLITNYFPPEKGAASNRIHSMACALQEHGYEVQIVCPFPNYPKGEIFDGFKGRIYSKSVKEKLTIHRLWVWPSISKNKFIRLLSMLSFSISLKVYFLFKKIPDKVIIQYSPVFVGFTAVFWSWVFRKKIVLNVSDLWPLAGFEMGILKKGVYYSLLENLERFCYKKASLVLGQSEEILNYVSSVGIKKSSFLYRNIPRFEPPELKKAQRADEISIVYGGLLGLAQGMYKICSTLSIPDGIHLHIYGAGAEAKKIASLKNPKITVHGEVSREQLHIALQNYDIAFIPLVNRIYGSVPSKIFEYSRVGLPLLLYAGGEADSLVVHYKLGWSIPVNNIEQLQLFLTTLTRKKLNEFPKKSIQQTAITQFNFDAQFEDLIQKLEII